MAGFQASDTMPKFGHVTDLREQWLVRTDGALAHRLQDREISTHLCENRCRNQQIREDFPLARDEQDHIEHEARAREHARRRQAEVDAEIAREMAEINLRRQRRQRHEPPPQPSSSRAPAPSPPPLLALAADAHELGLSPDELDDIRRRMEQEERDARLARELSHQHDDGDTLFTDMKFAVEAQDGELARLLQEREYKKLQRAKEKARQKALLKKQQRLEAAQQTHNSNECTSLPQPELCDAYSNPRDIIRENRLRLCKSVDSDLNYIEPFQKERIESKASALKAIDISNQYIAQQSQLVTSNKNISHSQSRSFESDKCGPRVGVGHRHPPPPPACSKKPRFPDPVSIRPASHYPADNPAATEPHSQNLPHSYSENNNLYSSTFSSDSGASSRLTSDRNENSKRLSVISDITADDLAKKKSKQADKEKKRRGCKIQ